MHDGGDAVLADRGADRRGVEDVSLDQITELHRGPVSRDQVVEHHDAVAGAVQGLGRVAADVAGPAGDEHGARASAQWRNR